MKRNTSFSKLGLIAVSILGMVLLAACGQSSTTAKPASAAPTSNAQVRAQDSSFLRKLYAPHPAGQPQQSAKHRRPAQ